jgi:hypothetical protein
VISGELADGQFGFVREQALGNELAQHTNENRMSTNRTGAHHFHTEPGG